MREGGVGEGKTNKLKGNEKGNNMIGRKRNEKKEKKNEQNVENE